MTGAIIKKPFDTIIPYEKNQELLKLKKNSYLIISKKIKKFNNLRFFGSDYKKRSSSFKERRFNKTFRYFSFKKL